MKSDYERGFDDAIRQINRVACPPGLVATPFVVGDAAQGVIGIFQLPPEMMMRPRPIPLATGKSFVETVCRWRDVTLTPTETETP